MKYPIAVDSNYAIWRGFNNQYWPALYLFDGRGNVRHTQFGEGGYAESEQAIQQLLTEVGARIAGHSLTLIEGTRDRSGSRLGRRETAGERCRV